MLSDVIRIILRLLRLASKRVTVSRDEQIICAISSCVKTLSIRMRASDSPFSLLHSSNSLANLALAVCGRSNDLVRSVSSVNSSAQYLQYGLSAGCALSMSSINSAREMKSVRHGSRVFTVASYEEFRSTEFRPSTSPAWAMRSITTRPSLDEIDTVALPVRSM